MVKQLFDEQKVSVAAFTHTPVTEAPEHSPETFPLAPLKASVTSTLKQVSPLGGGAATDAPVRASRARITTNTNKIFFTSSYPFLDLSCHNSLTWSSSFVAVFPISLLLRCPPEAEHPGFALAEIV